MIEPKAPRRRTSAIQRKYLTYFIAIACCLSLCGCALKASRQGVPPEVESVVTTVGEDADEERYEKIHNEAAPEWRSAADLEKTVRVFSTVREKLGKVKSRQLHAASEETKSQEHSFVLTYQTKFERGEGMETFTLVERNRQWLLAKYFVNSIALQ